MNEEIMAAGAGAPARTLAVVTEEIRYLDNQAKRLMLGHSIEIGRRLKEAKELVPYGEWGTYIRDQLNYSQSTAQNFMRIFEEYGAAQQSLFGPVAESQALGNLSYTKALALLAVPREEREEFAAEVDAEHISSRELAEAIRERDEARKALQTSEARLADTQRTLSETDKQVTELRGKLQQAWDDVQAADEQAVENEKALKARITELESRPVEVAVQEPDPAEVEKRAAELAAAAKAEAEKQAAAAKAEAAEQVKKARDKAKADRDALLAKVKEAEEKLAAAGEEDKAEAGRLRAEAEQLRKQLAMSDQAMVIFKVRFSAWQQAHQQMSEAFGAIQDEETKEKLRTAIRTQVKMWGYADAGQ